MQSRPATSPPITGTPPCRVATRRISSRSSSIVAPTVTGVIVPGTLLNIDRPMTYDRHVPGMIPDGPSRLIVGMTGATGGIFGVRLLEALRGSVIETHLV